MAALWRDASRISCSLLVFVAATAGQCDLERLDGATLDPQQFESAIRQKKPIILTGLTEGWAAADLATGWANATAFAESFGEYDLPLRASDDLAYRGSAFAAERVRVDAYVEGRRGRAGDEALFSNIEEPLSAALHGQYDWPEYLDGVTYDNIVGVGREGSGVPFHRHAENWIATFGKKRWCPPQPLTAPSPRACAHALRAPRCYARAGSCCRRTSPTLP